MFRGHVSSVQASKARAIVNLAGQKKWACFATNSARKAGLVFLFGAGGTQLAAAVGSIDRFTRACYQRITALSNLSDPSAEQSVKITSTKDNLEWTSEPPGPRCFTASDRS